MIKCSCCGNTIHNKPSIVMTLNKSNLGSKNDTTKASEKITIFLCKKCVTDMYEEVQHAEERMDTVESKFGIIENQLYKYLEIYLEGIDSSKEYENEPLPYSFAKNFLAHTVKHLNDMEEKDHLNKTSITFKNMINTLLDIIYEGHDFENIPLDEFCQEIVHACEHYIDEMKAHFEKFNAMLKNITDTMTNNMTPMEKSSTTNTKTSNSIDSIISTPSKIKKELDKYVIGQEHAKKIVSVGIYNHYKRIQNNKNDIKKSNIMLIGATGSGKTEIARTVAKILDVPFAIADATSITEAGYVGDDVETMLLKLISAANGDISKAEHGIIYIDEIDKIARRETHGRDVGGEGVQQALLKIVEGNDISISVKSKTNPMGANININTENILFICGGAFESITMAEENNKKPLGFNAVVLDENADKKIIDSKDLIKFGMIPELVGRFPIIAQLDTLTKDDLKRILVEPENSIVKQYKDLLSIDNIDLDFTNSALEYIATQAFDNKTGARGLKTVLESNMLDVMYDIPDHKNVYKVQVGVKDGILDFRKMEKNSKKSKKSK